MNAMIGNETDNEMTVIRMSHEELVDRIWKQAEDALNLLMTIDPEACHRLADCYATPTEESFQ